MSAPPGKKEHPGGQGGPVSASVIWASTGPPGKWKPVDGESTGTKRQSGEMARLRLKGTLITLSAASPQPLGSLPVGSPYTAAAQQSEQVREP